jgi:hypothetical protein
MIPTVAQFEVIRRFFASRSIDLRCSACKRDDWAVEDILPPAEVEGPPPAMPGATVPLVQFECRTCGHIVYFNAVTLGLGR